MPLCIVISMFPIEHELSRFFYIASKSQAKIRTQYSILYIELMLLSMDYLLAMVSRRWPTLSLTVPPTNVIATNTFHSRGAGHKID